MLYRRGDSLLYVTPWCRNLQEMASHQETIFGKYFAVGAKGGMGGLELPAFAAEHTEVLYAKARGRPLGYMFDVAQAFVYQVCWRRVGEGRDTLAPKGRGESVAQSF